MERFALSILSEIFDNKRQEVLASKEALSLADLQSRIAGLPPTKGFVRALKDSDHEVALIAEVKKGSPSQGTIRADFSPEAVAEAYRRAGADCLSVLTDAKYFSGSAENLMRVRAATNLPLLRKDFIDDPYQVYEARAWGADAILLIVAALSRAQIEELGGLAKSLDLDVLVEVHDEADLDFIEGMDLELVGVNNRDLKTLKTDLETTARLAPRIQGLMVSESALSQKADVDRVSKVGARAVLIGTAFCAAPDIESKVREVMGW